MRIEASVTSSTRLSNAWLSAQEATEDRDSATAALAEYRRDGGTAAESFFGALAAETQATYGTDEE